MEEFLRSLIAQAAGVTLVNGPDTSAPLAAVPEGVSLRSLEKFMPAPSRIGGVVSMYRTSDFVRYVNQFKTDGARIFVAPEIAFTRGGVLATAYLDYPKPGEPAWTSHVVKLLVQPSLEYKLLTSLENDGLITQDKFALRLRDVARFCTTLSSADLVEIAQTMTLSSKGDFATIEDNFTGSVRFGYDVQVTAKSDATSRKNIEVPREIGFNIPVLLGGDPVDLTAELLYRIPASKEEKVKMGIRMPDRLFVERAVLEQSAEKLEAATSVPVAVGESYVPIDPTE